MKKSNYLTKYSFAVYGLGLSGRSVVRYLKRKRVKKIFIWDDKIFYKNQKKKNLFKESLNKVDYIVMSPGISVSDSRYRKYLLKNRKKIITDLDLFYLENSSIKTLVVTGTNGKSTTCKLLEHLLKTNKTDVKLGGNIGKPVLDLKIRKNTTVVIEASSFQLAYSQFLIPTYAILLNITKDHIDWHKNIAHYVNSKFKIFSRQNEKNYAFLNNHKLIKIFKKNNFKSKLIRVENKNLIPQVKKLIKNSYLLSKPNFENLIFTYKVAKILKIKTKFFLDAVNTFKGLPHRHEFFFQKKEISFINDSKATSFDASKYALGKNNNILWIVGGQPKLGDKFKLKNLKKNIIKAYVIGKHTNFFTNQLIKKIKYKISYNLKKAIIDIFQDLTDLKTTKLTILLSPASASYDQFKNFVDRGNQFKKLINIYAKKFI
jgi:UDP-N-acetylmuramoylalanine--D-glutamate ligase